MLRRFLIICCLFFFSRLVCAANNLEVLGYVLRDTSLQTSEAHIKSLTLIVPQAYQVNESGLVWGSVNPQLLHLAAKNNVKIMPLVTNADFSKRKTHDFLVNPAAQAHAIQLLESACVTSHYYGFQIDFEHMNIEDRNAFSRFIEQTAAILHRDKCALSVTVVPRLTDDAPTTAMAKTRLKNWSGVYDYAALGKSVDFVTLMAYDQHSSDTTPGPEASAPWVEKIVQYAVKYIPPEKLFLGLATNSNLWFSVYGGGTSAAPIGYGQVQDLVKKHQVKLFWDDVEKTIYTFFPDSNNLNDFIFVENVQTFRPKLDLAKKYRIHGIALWRLGVGDPKIWNEL